MDTRDGSIKYFTETDELPKHFVRLSENEVKKLDKRTGKDALQMLKAMRKSEVRKQKRTLGRKLSSAEMQKIKEGKY